MMKNRDRASIDAFLIAPAANALRIERIDVLRRRVRDAQAGFSLRELPAKLSKTRLPRRQDYILAKVRFRIFGQPEIELR